MNRVIFFILIFVRGCTCLIYKLNDTEYTRMPPVFHLDDYDHCLIDPNGIYCFADIDLVSDTPNELLTMIRNYSDYTRKHFNHTQLHHGVCLTKTCKDLLKNNTDEIKNVLENCLNNSLWENYQLKCKISKPITCNNMGIIEKDTGDIVLAYFLLILLLANIVGSLYEIIFVKDKDKGSKLLQCFSIPHNFNKLVSSYKNLDSREERLKCFHGLRTITMMAVIYCHSLLPFALGPENPRYVEMLYEDISQFIFINGTIIVQTFFIISGCLLAYKLEIYAEEHEIRWTLIPKAIIVTWMNLTPSYAVVLGLTSTWLRYAGSGPFWNLVTSKEIEDCRSKGWTHLLYINNYYDNTQCMVQSWYLGAYMQLNIVGYIFCILAWNGIRRKIAITLLFIFGMLAPAAHVYFQDLDAVLMVNPETARTFAENQTFNNVYKRGHTNVVNFITGIILGFLIYKWQINKTDFEKYKKYRFLLLLTFPAILGSMYIGSIFYVDGSNASIYMRTVFAAMIKPAYGLVVSLLIIGCVFKIESLHVTFFLDIYRAFLEWNGWKIPSKLCYCAFVLHIMIVRATAGIRKTLITLNDFNMLENAITFIVVSYLAAIPFWIIIDAPLTGLLKYCFFNSFRSKTPKPETNNVSLKSDNETDRTEEANNRNDNV